MAKQQTVFVVDDDQASRDSVAAQGLSQGLAVETFASAEEFLATFDRTCRGCLVTDLRMGEMDGLELQERLLAERVSLPVILITGFGDVPNAVQAMKNGAITFLQKPCGEHELLASIRTALAWDERQQEQFAQREEIQQRLASLTSDESNVLEFLLGGKANKVIAAQLDIGLRTVELRRATIMKKMRADSLAALVRMAMAVQTVPE